MTHTVEPNRRLDSLDQFRGYTVLGMLLVNFVGGFEACHYVLKHHNTFCSYADTIMPQFFFAVGFAFRLTFLRRIETLGARIAYGRAVRRLVGLLLVAWVVYSADAPAQTWDRLVSQGWWQAIREPLKRDWFQTLTHIAITSLWILPVIRARAVVRIVYLLISSALHLGVSWWFYFAWVNNGQPNGIDGGPLGFLTWTVPMVVGTLAYDIVKSRHHVARRLSVAAGVLMLTGYLLSCGTRFYDRATPIPSSESPQRLAVSPVIPTSEAWQRVAGQVRREGWRRVMAEPPFVPPPHPADEIGQSDRFRSWNYWMMSQRGGTLSYLVFSSGFSAQIYLLFYLACDRGGWALGVLRTFGTNALAAYVLHMLVAAAVLPFMPRDCPAWYLVAGCGVYFAVNYLLIRSLERNQIYLRL